MAKKVMVFDEVYRMLKEVKEQRIEDGWKRGYSLEQIASEAIIFWCNQGDADRFKNENSVNRILEEGWKRVSEGGSNV